MPQDLGSNPRSPYFLYNIFLQEIQCTHELGVHHIPSPSNTPDGQIWWPSLRAYQKASQTQCTGLAKVKRTSPQLGQISCFLHPPIRPIFSPHIFLFIIHFNYFILFYLITNQKLFSFYQKNHQKYFYVQINLEFYFSSINQLI